MAPKFTTEAALDTFLSEPTEPVVALMKRLEGDVMILGVGGKMGLTLSNLAKRAAEAAGVKKRIIGVARFSDPHGREWLEENGVETFTVDLLRRDQVARLPEAANVLFLAGRKFGTHGDEHLTWATNTLVPAHVAERFRGSRIVAFSTGCVYPFVTPDSGGCAESHPVAPVGEYAQSCLGRERIFEYYCREQGTPVCLLRLNYAIDLRYGVLHDLAHRILNEQAIELGMGSFNCIWQGDANACALLALEHCRCPAKVLNLTGPGVLSTQDIAEQLAEALGRRARFAGRKAPTAYLNDASQILALLGPTTVSIEEMIRWTAEWTLAGGVSRNAPTHFEIRDGHF
jgi:nucleoside-diphosphate-sugar epimerase